MTTVLTKEGYKVTSWWEDSVWRVNIRDKHTLLFNLKDKTIQEDQYRYDYNTNDYLNYHYVWEWKRMDNGQIMRRRQYDSGGFSASPEMWQDIVDSIMEFLVNREITG